MYEGDQKLAKAGLRFMRSGPCACLQIDLLGALKTESSEDGKCFMILSSLSRISLHNLGHVPDGVWIVPVFEQFPWMKFTIYPKVTGRRCGCWSIMRTSSKF
jgi:hypothetical protein